MTFILATFFLFLGIAIGSFLNVVILRYNTGLSFAEGRSVCFSCGKTLQWYELIPVISYVFQAGRCRGCRSKISMQYPAVELTTGVLFLALFAKINPQTLSELGYLFYTLVIWSLLIVIAVYDLRHKIIPDGIVYAFAALSFLQLFFTPETFVVPGLWALLAGPLMAAPFFLLWLVSRGTWMGLGDAKLALGIGWLLGPVFGTSAIILSFWLGAIVGIALLLLKYLSRLGFFHRIALFFGATTIIIKSELPFAPFLILGILIVYFWHIDVTGLSLLLYGTL